MEVISYTILSFRICLTWIELGNHESTNELMLFNCLHCISIDFMQQKYQLHFNFCTKMASFIGNSFKIRF